MTDQKVLQMPKAQHVTAENFEQTIKEAKLPVLVDFYAEWCGPCKLAAPIIDKLSAEYKDKAMIVKLDVDHANEISAKYDVHSIPTVMTFKDGKVVESKVGFPGEAFYRQMLERAIGDDMAKAA